jgi:hypothetical protein
MRGSIELRGNLSASIASHLYVAQRQGTSVYVPGVHNGTSGRARALGLLVAAAVSLA